jgi:hypothetical protein
MKRNEIEGNQVVGVYVLNIHGQELPEPFGAIISVIKKHSAFQANISLVTVLYVMRVLQNYRPCR